jgi:hypothetical protein
VYSLKQWAFSLLLVPVMFFNLYAGEQKQETGQIKAIQKTQQNELEEKADSEKAVEKIDTSDYENMIFSDYFTIYNTEFSKELKRKREQLGSLEELSIINTYAFHNWFFPYEAHQTPLDQRELKKARRFVFGVLGDSLREFSNEVKWINTLEDQGSRRLKYRLFAKKDPAIKEFYSPTLQDEERIEDREDQETTTLFGNLEQALGEGHEFHAGAGVYFYNRDLGVNANARIEDFTLFNKYFFRKASLKLNIHRHAKFKIQSFFHENIYAQFEYETENMFDNHQEWVFSITNEIKDPRSNISVFFGQDKESSFIGVNYRFASKLIFLS